MIPFKAVPVGDVGEPWDAKPELITGYDTFTWVDRYREAGSVEIAGPPSADLATQLPLGTLVSHSGSLGWAMIESHNYENDQDGVPVFTAKGRSLEAWLTYRVVGEFETNTTPNYADGPPIFTLASDDVWDQAKALIDTHALGGEMAKLACESAYGIQNEVLFSVTPEARVLERRDVYSVLLELLAIQDLGIKVVRGRSSRGSLTFMPSGAAAVSDVTYFLIHAGVDRSNDIAFSWYRGDITDMAALNTDELNFNSASVVGSYGVVRASQGTPSKFWRRTCVVDAGDLDRDWNTGDTWTPFQTRLGEFGKRFLSVKTGIKMTDASVGSKNPYVYGVDYNIGDIVMLEGDLRLLEPRRITEHTTVLTKDDVQQIPTFSILGV